MGKRGYDPIAISLRGWDYPRTEDNKVDKDKIKKEFMESRHYSWTAFALDKKWPVVKTQQDLPTNKWVDDKKKEFATVQGELLTDSMFQQRFNYNKQVIETLKSYPQDHDRIRNILLYSVMQWEKDIKEDIETEAKLPKGHRLQENERKFRVKPFDLLSMTGAIHKLTESKYKSLLMNDWSMRMSEEFNPKDQKEKALEKNEGFEVTLIGGNKLTEQQIKGYIEQYIDKPPQDIDEPEN